MPPFSEPVAQGAREAWLSVALGTRGKCFVGIVNMTRGIPSPQLTTEKSSGDGFDVGYIELGQGALSS